MAIPHPQYHGREFAQREHERSECVRHIWLVTEAWFVQRHPDNATDVKWPSQEPDRREGIIVLELNSHKKELDQCLKVAEFIRHGSLLDLVPHEKFEKGEVKSKLLLSFFAGIMSAEWSDEELMERIKRFINVGEF